MITSPQIQAFRLNTKKQTALAKVLQTEIMQEVLALIESSITPQQASKLQAIPGLHHDSVVAREYHRLLGIQQAIDTIRGLPTPPPKKPEQEAPPQMWADEPPDLVS